jgi:branched-chain amino acid transport system ATP-binding protein
MDEPSAGLAPLVTHMIFETVRRLNEEIGLTVMMIEENARQGLEVSHRGYVLELGRNSYTGPGQELLNNQEVTAAFLGG